MPTPLPGAKATLLLLPLLVAVLLLVGARTGLVGSTETRYAEIARAMVERGDPVVPTLNGAPHLEKPPFTYWVLALTFLVTGASDVAARLPSLLAAALTVWVVAGAARRLAPPGTDPREVGRGAAIVLGTMPAFVLLGQTVSTDMWLVCCSTVAGVALLECFRTDGRPGLRWTLACFAALGVGFVVKGPAVLLTPLVGAAAVAWSKRSLRPLRPLVHPLGWLVFLGTALPWYLLAERALPGLLDLYVTRRATGGVMAGAHHQNPIWVVWGPVLLGTAPWSATWVAAVPALARRKLLAPLGAMALATPVFFTVATSRLLTYAMPAIPFVALIAALGAVGDPRPGLAWGAHGRRATVVFAGVVTSAALLAFAFLTWPALRAAVGDPLPLPLRPDTARQGLPWFDGAALLLAAALATGACLWARGRGAAWTRTAAPTVAFAFVLVVASVYPHAPETVGAHRHLLEPALGWVGPDDEVGVAVHKDGDWALLPFYLRREARWFGYGERLGLRPPSEDAPANFRALDDLGDWFRAPGRRWLLLRTVVKDPRRDPWRRLGDAPHRVVSRGDLYTLIVNR